MHAWSGERAEARLTGREPGLEPAAPRLPGNAEKAVSLLQHPERTAYLLKISGIPTARGARPEPGTRTYRIHMFENRVLMLEKSRQPTQWLREAWGEPSFEQIDPADDDYEASAVIRLARRALYAAGLHYGHLVLHAASPHRVKVHAVSADWLLQHQGRLRTAAEAWWAEEQGRWSGSPIMLGADPEFALRHPDGHMVLASDFMGTNGVVGCDSTRYREELALHQHPLVELRPAPSANPDLLFLRIVKALRTAAKKIDNPSIEWVSGGMPFEGYPIGGHIHFSGIRPDYQLLRQLDAYLALPLVLIEDAGCRMRRPRYGYLGDMREKDYGGTPGFEYRTLPSWLVDPIVTRGVLHLARLIADSSHHLMINELSPGLVRAYYRGEQERIKPLVTAMWEELRQLPGYARSGAVLDRYFARLLSGNVWPADRDLRIVWSHYSGKR